MKDIVYSIIIGSKCIGNKEIYFREVAILGFASYEDTYAWVFYKLQDYDNALLWVKKALKSGGDSSPTIVEHYGDILFQLNQKDQALEQWQIAKEMGSESDFIDQKINEKQLYE